MHTSLMNVTGGNYYGVVLLGEFKSDVTVRWVEFVNLGADDGGDKVCTLLGMASEYADTFKICLSASTCDGTLFCKEAVEDLVHGHIRLIGGVAREFI